MRFVTGHSRHGGLPPDLDWRAIADPSTTTIFYMAARTAAEIAERLTRVGLYGETPVVIATALGRPGEKMWRGTLRGLSAYDPQGTSEPVIIGIGRAFGARRKLGAIEFLAEQRIVS